MRRSAMTIVAGALVLGAGAPLAAQNAANVEVRWTGRVQVQFNTSSVGDDEVEVPVSSAAFETRRVRLAAEVTLRDWIFGIVEADYAQGNVGLRKAYMDLLLDDAFALRIGHAKRPFSRIFLTSSLDVLPIERGLRIRGVPDAYARADAEQPAPVLGPAGIMGDAFALLEALGHADYEIGASVHGALGALQYEVGAYNGTGQERRDTNDAKAFAGRATYALEDTPLSLGAGVSYQEVGIGDESDGGTAYLVDAEWGRFRAPGLHVIVEGVTGENHFVDESFAGVQGWIAWFHGLGGRAATRSTSSRRLEGVEFVGRASWGDPNTSVDDDAGMLLTPGVNLYLFDRNRLSLNWDVFVPGGDRFETEHAVRAQAQFAFSF
jgi:Phosphate-selective porin O and P